MRLLAVCVLLSCAVACSGGRDNELARNLGTARDASADAEAELESDAEVADADVGNVEDASVAMDATLGEDAASSEDAAVDAQVDAATGFSITLLRGDSVLPGQTVIFHDANGAATETHTTDENGRVAASSAPASATAVITFSGQNPAASAQVYTFTQLADGDQLVLKLSGRASEPNLTPAYRLTHAALPEELTISHVRTVNGESDCSTYSTVYDAPYTTVDFGWIAGCHNPASNTLLSAALEYESWRAVRYAWARGVPAFTPNTTEWLPVTMGNWVEPGELRVDAYALPPERSARLAVRLWSDGLSFSGDFNRGFHDLVAGETSRDVRVPYPPGFAQEYSYQLNVSDIEPNQEATVWTREPVGAEPGISFASALPGPGAGRLDTSSGRTRYTWSNTTAPSNVDGTVVVISLEGPSPVPWMLIAPGGVTSIELPVLNQAYLQGFQPSAAGSSISYFASTREQGYRDFLRQPVRPWLLQLTGEDGMPAHLLTRELPAQTSLSATTWRRPYEPEI